MVYDSGLENHSFDWLIFPETGGFGRFCPALFAQFLSRSGYSDGTKVGTPPELPADAVETPPSAWQLAEGRGMCEWTYFARGRYSGRIKIGKSRMPEYRVGQLSLATYGEPSDILLTLRGGHLEKAYHRVFRQWHEGHEWFAPHPDILAEITRLCRHMGD